MVPADKIAAALVEADGSVARAAQIVGLTPAGVWYRLKRDPDLVRVREEALPAQAERLADRLLSIAEGDAEALGVPVSVETQLRALTVALTRGPAGRVAGWGDRVDVRHAGVVAVGLTQLSDEMLLALAGDDEGEP